MLADHDRTLIVKDERIAHLEAQYQKERQRNLNAADAAARSAAASPIDEAPPPLPGLAESLADELDAASDEYDEFNYEQIELSDITAVYQAAPFTPIRPEHSIDVNEAASVAPIDATKPTHTLTVDKVASVTPIDVTKPTLTVSVNEAGSVIPVGRKVNTTSLTLRLIDTASIAVSPVDAQLQFTTTSASDIALAPVLVTHEESPFEARPSKTPTANTGAQTTEVAPKPVEPAAQPTAPVVLVTKPNKLSLLQSILPLIATVLAFLCLMLYTEVQAWRTANGVGFGYGNGGRYSRSGAYGNGRYLFGFIPIAMDVGNSWWSELFAKYASVGITAFEDWAGISYEPLY
ncbi:hypothetical protein EK21DRAFT_64260 [Setomelanomma holmii]|uniref:Uncharacterized protein n=1 Tax=Setomelanomma holmii TaxID=210430 RepID=A0A9P4LPJ4_9PLEO|nr:hypothetical protein EK21DRAFT_64260 [Setomelanomma holmii]